LTSANVDFDETVPPGEPRFPFLGMDVEGETEEPSVLTVATQRVMRALQVLGTMTINQMAQVGECDGQSAHNIADGLQWVGIVAWDPIVQGYRYRGQITDRPLRLDRLAETYEVLKAERDRKVQELRELMAEVAELENDAD
jgi:hypothetical protein